MFTAGQNLFRERPWLLVRTELPYRRQKTPRMRRKAAFGVFCLTTVYPTDTLGAHGNSGRKSSGKKGKHIKKYRKWSGNIRKKFINLFGARCRRFNSCHLDQKERVGFCLSSLFRSVWLTQSLENPQGFSWVLRRQYLRQAPSRRKTEVPSPVTSTKHDNKPKCSFAAKVKAERSPSPPFSISYSSSFRFLP